MTLPESLVLTSGRPIVLLPPRGAAPDPRRILLAWKARPEAVRAVAGAMPLLARADAVQVVVVDDEGAPGYGYEPGADIAEHLARHGARVEVLRLSSRGEDVGRLLLSQADSLRRRPPRDGRLRPLAAARTPVRRRDAHGAHGGSAASVDVPVKPMGSDVGEQAGQAVERASARIGAAVMDRCRKSAVAPAAGGAL